MPSREWVEAALPAASKTNQADAAKPLFYTQASNGQLKLRVTQFDYPDGMTDERLSAFVDHIRLGYQQYAFGPVTEGVGRAGEFSFVKLDARYRGRGWMRARAYFCDKRAYLVEVGGQEQDPKRADECWKAIDLGGESPLNAAAFKTMVDLREKKRAAAAAYSKPPSNAGVYFIEFLAVAGAILGGLWVSIELARKVRAPGGLKLRLFGRRRRRRHRNPYKSAPCHDRAPAR